MTIQDIIVTTKGQDGLYGVYTVTLRGNSLVDCDGGCIYVAESVAHSIIKRARKHDFLVTVVDWEDDLTEAVAVYQRAELNMRTARTYASEAFMPLLDAAFEAGDQAEVRRLAEIFPDPVERSFVYDRIRQTFGKTA